MYAHLLSCVLQAGAKPDRLPVSWRCVFCCRRFGDCGTAASSAAADYARAARQRSGGNWRGERLMRTKRTRRKLPAAHSAAIAIIFVLIAVLIFVADLAAGQL